MSLNMRFAVSFINLHMYAYICIYIYNKLISFLCFIHCECVCPGRNDSSKANCMKSESNTSILAIKMRSFLGANFARELIALKKHVSRECFQLLLII